MSDSEDPKSSSAASSSASESESGSETGSSSSSAASTASSSSSASSSASSSEDERADPGSAPPAAEAIAPGDDHSDSDTDKDAAASAAAAPVSTPTPTATSTSTPYTPSYGTPVAGPKTTTTAAWGTPIAATNKEKQRVGITMAPGTSKKDYAGLKTNFAEGTTIPILICCVTCTPVEAESYEQDNSGMNCSLCCCLYNSNCLCGNLFNWTNNILCGILGSSCGCNRNAKCWWSPSILCIGPACAIGRFCGLGCTVCCTGCWLGNKKQTCSCCIVEYGNLPQDDD